MARTVFSVARNVVGRTRRMQRRWAVLVSLIVMVSAGLVLQAVHDTGVFELDGNAVTNVSHDWADVFAGTSGAAAATFVDDGSLNATIFTGGGSKDPQNLNQWAWKDGAGGLPDKDNLLHSFAARYSLTPSANCPSGGAATCDVLFFGSDRFDNSGDAQQGFWFFQNPVSTRYDTNNDGLLDADCPITIGGGTGFCDPTTGLAAAHRNGDLLIISDFSNGGTTSTISVYKWNSAVSGNLELLQTSDAANCATAGNNDAFCGIVNPNNGTATGGWGFTDKSGNHSFLNGEFYEGGVNLSTLGLSGECFASVASETRSSTSTTATLKDFVIGTFGRCTSGLTTTPKTGAGADIPVGGLSIGTGSVSVKDSATLTIGGSPTWTGTLKFFLCGPNAGLCTTGGTQIGDAAGITVTNATLQPILSDAATVTSAGTYCWRGEFDSNTSGVPDAADATAGECFVVNPKTPSISTTAGGTVQIGNAVTDNATLLGTAAKPGSPVINPTTPGGAAGGTITFFLYGPAADPNAPTCTTLAAGFPATGIVASVTGDGSYGPVSFTPTSAGTYVWGANYSGDSPNTTIVNGVCPAASETVVVTPKQPAITTTATAGPVNLGQSIDDVAHLTGTNVKPDGSPAGGTITFSLYGPSASAVCTTAIATRVVNVSGDGDYTASTGTGTGTLTPTAAGTYYWIAAYSGDLPNTKSVSGACGDANEASVIQQLQPTISTAQTFTVKDSATISVTGGGNLAGSVHFRLFETMDCTGATLVDQSVGVAGASPQSRETTPVSITTSKPILSWLVEYTSTNQAHKNVTSSCRTENAALSIVQ
jgi:hypothetical protein